jgi:hypothetical protein
MKEKQHACISLLLLKSIKGTAMFNILTRYMEYICSAEVVF